METTILLSYLLLIVESMLLQLLIFEDKTSRGVSFPSLLACIVNRLKVVLLFSGLPPFGAFIMMVKCWWRMSCRIQSGSASAEGVSLLRCSPPKRVHWDVNTSHCVIFASTFFLFLLQARQWKKYINSFDVTNNERQSEQRVWWWLYFKAWNSYNVEKKVIEIVSKVIQWIVFQLYGNNKIWNFLVKLSVPGFFYVRRTSTGPIWAMTDCYPGIYVKVDELH